MFKAHHRQYVTIQLPMPSEYGEAHESMGKNLGRVNSMRRSPLVCSVHMAGTILGVSPDAVKLRVIRMTRPLPPGCSAIAPSFGAPLAGERSGRCVHFYVLYLCITTLVAD